MIPKSQARPLVAIRKAHHRLAHSRPQSTHSTHSTHSIPSPTYLPLPLISDPSTFATLPTQNHHHYHPSPCAFPQGYFTSHIPAITQWFLPPSSNPSTTTPTTTSPNCGLKIWSFSSTLHTLADANPDLLVPIEATFHPPATTDKKPTSMHTKFSQTYLPLSLFLTYLLSPRSPNLPSMYLAQHHIPPHHPLRDALTPPPPLVPARMVGDPTLWLGSAVSATSPLHRDPRPNLFVQMAGRKRVVLFEPKQGETVMGELLGNEAARKRLRGEEMMEGFERAKVDGWVWGFPEIAQVQQQEEHKSCDNTVEVNLDHDQGRRIFGYEIEVGSGDGIYIPKGWWHAVRAVKEVDDETGVEGVCASVILHFYSFSVCICALRFRLYTDEDSRLIGGSNFSQPRTSPRYMYTLECSAVSNKQDLKECTPGCKPLCNTCFHQNHLLCKNIPQQKLKVPLPTDLYE